MRVSPRNSVRTLIIALCGGVILALGTAAAAEPPVNPDFPLGTQHPAPELPGPGEPGEQAERAQDLGGDLVTRLIDMGADLAKCGLNLIAPSVQCD